MDSGIDSEQKQLLSQQKQDIQPIVVEDSRFVVPSEQPPSITIGAQSQQQSIQAKASNNDGDVDPDTGFVNASVNENSYTQPNADEHELETRLK